MKQLTSAQIRQMWLDFWKSKGHAVEPSANLVPVNDPTLLWINSGVATLKKYFDGSVIPENPRITNSVIAKVLKKYNVKVVDKAFSAILDQYVTGSGASSSSSSSSSK